MLWPQLPYEHMAGRPEDHAQPENNDKGLTPAFVALHAGEREFVISPLDAGRLQMDALADEKNWKRRDAEKADDAWYRSCEDLEWPIAFWWGRRPSDPVQRIRMAVSAVLDLADHKAGKDMAGDEAKWREREQRFRDQSECWRDATKRLLGTEWDFEHLWADARSAATEDDYEAEAARIAAELAAAREALEAAQAAMQRLEAYKAPRLHRGGRSDRSLERFVVRRLAWAWRAIIGTEPPKSKSGPFVRFCVAVWRDVGLPEGGDLEGVIGSIAEVME